MTTLSQADAADLFRKEPDRFLDVGAGEAAYRRIGSGPDVLFVHGWPVSGATFRKLLPHLVDHVTCHLIDLPSAGSSRFSADTPMSVQQHIETVKRVVDLLEFESVALVGHNSGGLIARHAMVGDQRLRAFGLIDTEMPTLGWRFRSFIASRHVPGLGAALGWAAGRPRVRRSRLVLGEAFADRSLLDGEFDEFFLQPIAADPTRLRASMKVLKSFDVQHIRDLERIHRQIDVPVQLVWGEQDVFFPVENARADLDSFPNAKLAVIPGAGLFSHEERPAEVAAALLPTLAV